MKKTIIVTLLSMCMLFFTAGCKCTGKRCGDNKPVAPETYSDEKGDKADPVLPPMEYWWEM